MVKTRTPHQPDAPVVGTMLVLAAAASVLVSCVLVMAGEVLRPWDLATVGGLVVAMFVGEFLRVETSSGRNIAPVSTASAVALALAVQVGRTPLGFGAPTVVLAVAVTLLASLIWIEPRDSLRLRAAGHSIRILIAGFLALMVSEVPILSGRTVSEASIAGELTSWRLVLIFVALAIVAQALELGLHVWLRSSLSSRHWVDILREDATEMLPIAGAAMSTGIVVAVGMGSLSLAAIPLFLSPLVLMRYAIDRRRHAELARRQATTALSRLTDLAGYTTQGHSERVATVAARVSQALRLTERERLDLEAASLLHDIGQVAMHHPVPDGATIGLAPLDQQRIADDSAELVTRTGAMGEAAKIICAYPTSYRVMHEEGTPLSLPARVLKVCNAYDDLTRGDERLRDAALERITLGLGYEYDPDVVAALKAATRPAESPKR